MSTWQERRSVFLHEFCRERGCGDGRIHRVLSGTQLYSGDAGDEFLCTHIRDECTSCGKVAAESSHILWPCMELEGIFDRFVRDPADRNGFDDEINKVFRRAGGAWLRVS